MSSTNIHSPLKARTNSLNCIKLMTGDCRLTTNCAAIMAAADTSDTAVALAEQSAAKVSFQRQPPTRPPSQNVNSVASAELPAGQFSGNNANYAKFAVTTAAFAAF